jgi:Xaa-Pro aminopeptidase
MLVNILRLQARMDEEGLDGLVATTLPNVLYFADFYSIALAGFPYDGQCYAVITRDAPGRPLIVTSTVELDQMLDGHARDAVRFGTFYREGPFDGAGLTEDEQWLKRASMETEGAAGPFDALVTALGRLGLADKKVGIDELGFQAGFAEALAEKLPQARFSQVSGMLRWVRKVKTEEEIRRLRASAHITEQAIAAAASIAREGVTEYELAREFERAIVGQGGRPQFTLIRIGRNAVAGQRTPGRTALQKGDTIWFDVGATFEGYWSDLARIYALGDPGERARSLYAALLEGEEVGIARTRVGMTGEELFNVTMEATRAAGHPGYRRHHVGHGIGAEVYEPPILRPGNTDLIEDGTVVNIETPYYEFGLGALHVEDPYVVRADGRHELLTTLGRELHVLPE